MFFNPLPVNQDNFLEESQSLSDDISEEGATPFFNYFYVDEMPDAEI